MCFTLQRYKFSSKSQQCLLTVAACYRCVLPCKGTNFQANHNRVETKYGVHDDVFYLAKVQIFKQITTIGEIAVTFSVMCFTLQRYKFSSKSQRVLVECHEVLGCVLPCKGTNFQANHNYIFN